MIDFVAAREAMVDRQVRTADVTLYPIIAAMLAVPREDFVPPALRPVAYLTPLWHGVALCRSLSLGIATLGGALIHIGYLAGLAVVGVAVGNRSYRRRLYV